MRSVCHGLSVIELPLIIARRHLVAGRLRQTREVEPQMPLADDRGPIPGLLHHRGDRLATVLDQMLAVADQHATFSADYASSTDRSPHHIGLVYTQPMAYARR